MGITVENGGILTTVQDEEDSEIRHLVFPHPVPWTRVLSTLPICW